MACTTELCASLGFGHGLGEEVGVLVGGKEGAHDCVVERVGGEPFGVTGLRSVALTPTAGVVAVGGVSSGGPRPGEVAATATADDQSGQEVVRSVGSPLGDVLAPFERIACTASNRPSSTSGDGWPRSRCRGSGPGRGRCGCAGR